MAEHVFGYARYPNRSSYLKAEGNLSYLGFIRALEYIWSEAHPEIPFYATGSKTYPKYPCIVYSLELRRTHPDEPKMKHRETIPGDITNPYDTIVYGQRFQNIVNFAVLTESDPAVAEELIEIFEDFMAEFIPVFKKLGLSEIIYDRRVRDSGENRDNVDIIDRSVRYLITTEKLIRRDFGKLQEVLIDVAKFVQDATPVTQTIYAPSTPHVYIRETSI